MWPSAQDWLCDQITRLTSSERTLAGWIPVGERLPENPDKEVLVYAAGEFDGFGIDAYRFGPDGDAWENFGDDVTHWMPLPEEPVADGKLEIDLGDGHRIVLVEYKGEISGGDVRHPPVEGKCGGHGWISFEGRAWARGFTTPLQSWKVESDDPLTISPSIFCRACGDHGHIRNGKWERA